MVEIQISLFSSKGYKPMSTIIKVENPAEYNANKDKYKNLAVLKICQQRGMTSYDLKKYGYDEIRVRKYDKEKIDQENAERYEQIKKERGWKK